MAEGGLIPRSPDIHTGRNGIHIARVPRSDAEGAVVGGDALGRTNTLGSGTDGVSFRLVDGVAITTKAMTIVPAIP